MSQSEEDEQAKLKSLGVVYASYDESKRKSEWGYRAAYLAFASLFLSALAVLLLQLWQPIYSAWAICGISGLFFTVAFSIAFSAFGAQKE